MMPIVICQQCGRMFEVRPCKAQKAKYCSKACKDKAAHTRPRIKCKCCGSEFISRSNKQKYCSNICFNAAQSGMTREAYLALKEIEKADPRESMHLCVGIGGKTCGKLIPEGFRRCPECWKKLRGSSEVDDTSEYEVLGQAWV